MFRSIICFFKRKRIIESDGYFIPQVYEISAGWCGIDKSYRTWALKENISNYCLFNNLQDANDHLQNYVDHKKELSDTSKKKIHNMIPVPVFWRVLRKKND